VGAVIVGRGRLASIDAHFGGEEGNQPERKAWTQRAMYTVMNNASIPELNSVNRTAQHAIRIMIRPIVICGLTALRCTRAVALMLHLGGVSYLDPHSV
jgi:hypothetical protein